MRRNSNMERTDVKFWKNTHVKKWQPEICFTACVFIITYGFHYHTFTWCKSIPSQQNIHLLTNHGKETHTKMWCWTSKRKIWIEGLAGTQIHSLVSSSGFSYQNQTNAQLSRQNNQTQILYFAHLRIRQAQITDKNEKPKCNPLVHQITYRGHWIVFAVSDIC